jgi:SAM-dependent methyltransferase
MTRFSYAAGPFRVATISNHESSGEAMTGVTDWIDRTWYPGYKNNWDDWLFRERILGHLRPDMTVLDLGAGAGLLSQMNFRGLARRVCGVDLDVRVTQNPMLDEARIADAGSIPYDAGEFDLACANNVLEHLNEPLAVFLEVARVLRPGGVFLFKTPNRRHYVPIMARVTPHRFHQYVNERRGRTAADTFPTFYRANTGAAITRLAQESGMSVERIELVEGRPEYLRFAWPAYLLGTAYERVVNATDALAGCRVLLIGQLKKRDWHP